VTRLAKCLGLTLVAGLEAGLIFAAYGVDARALVHWLDSLPWLRVAAIEGAVAAGLIVWARSRFSHSTGSRRAR
jgi:hypothetical protein